jgi:hypothetical protein
MKEYKEYEFDNGTETIKVVKIGNTQFRVDNFKPKNKQEFVNCYKPFKKKVDGKEVTHNPWTFNRDKAWEFLKQYVKQEVKK